MSVVTAVPDDMELVETTLDIYRMDHMLQRTLFVCALEGALQDGVAALKERGITADADTVLVLAGELRTASAERCFFCTSDNVHKTGWLVSFDHPFMTWAELAQVACSCLGKYRTTRITLMRGWEKREVQAQIAERVPTRMDPERIMYTDKCSVPGCGQLFKVTAQNVAVGFAKTGLFRGWNRCPPCELKMKIRREQKQLEQSLERGIAVPGVGVVKRAPRKNALTPITPESKLPHGAAHGWGSLGDAPSLKEAFAKFKNGG